MLSGATGEELWRTDSTAPGAGGEVQFGAALDGGEDLTGDGVPDVVTASAGAGPVVNAGSVYVLSGVDGSVALRFDGDVVNALHGYDTRLVPDFDSDGTSDLLVLGRAGGSTQVRVLSSVTGALLFAADGGGIGTRYAADVVPDVDGDGTPEVAVGLPLLGNRGTVRLVSGATGATLWERSGSVGYRRLGAELVTVGDVDADGFDDLAAASTHFGTLLDPMTRVELVSGRDGALLAAWSTTGVLDALGDELAAPGDVDGDLVPDLATSFAEPLVPRTTTRVVSGASFATLAELVPLGATKLLPIGRAGDVDGDSRADVAIGHADAVVAASLATGAAGAPLFAVDGALVGDRWGRAVAPFGDLDGDGPRGGARRRARRGPRAGPVRRRRRRVAHDQRCRGQRLRGRRRRAG